MLTATLARTMIIAACCWRPRAWSQARPSRHPSASPSRSRPPRRFIGKARLMRSQRAYEHAAQALRSSGPRIAIALGCCAPPTGSLHHAMEQRLPASRCSTPRVRPNLRKRRHPPMTSTRKVRFAITDPRPAPEGMPGPVPAAPPNGYAPQGALTLRTRCRSLAGRQRLLSGAHRRGLVGPRTHRD